MTSLRIDLFSPQIEVKNRETKSCKYMHTFCPDQYHAFTLSLWTNLVVLMYVMTLKKYSIKKKTRIVATHLAVVVALQLV